MAARIDVYGRRERLDENGLFNASPYPVMLVGQDGDVLFAEVVVLFARMLEHCRLVFAKCVGGGGCVLPESSCRCSLGFTDIGARAWCRVGAGTGDVVNEAGGGLFFELVFRLDKCFSY